MKVSLITVLLYISTFSFSQERKFETNILAD